MVHDYPETCQWLEEGAVWPGHVDGVVFPTCVKSIVRNSPPPRPAGLAKCDRDTCLRWEADRFRFPPYQYKPGFVIGAFFPLANANCFTVWVLIIHLFVGLREKSKRTPKASKTCVNF